MAHFIRCIIGKEKIIKELAKNWIDASKVDLNEGFSVIPLTEVLIEDMNELVNFGNDIAYQEFELLSKSVEQVLKQISYSDKIGYIETEYFGGDGTQSAVLYSKGNIINGPLLTRTKWNVTDSKYKDEPIGERAINSILLNLGLNERKDMDCFDNLGLGNFRSNMKLLKAYNIK